jgi:hypothetical protein
MTVPLVALALATIVAFVYLTGRRLRRAIDVLLLVLEREEMGSVSRGRD